MQSANGALLGPFGLKTGLETAKPAATEVTAGFTNPVSAGRCTPSYQLGERIDNNPKHEDPRCSSRIFFGRNDCGGESRPPNGS